MKWNEEGRFEVTCGTCDAVYFCGQNCQEMYFREKDHLEVCELERKLSTWKADKDAKSLMRLYLKSIHQKVIEERKFEKNFKSLVQWKNHYSLDLDDWFERLPSNFLDYEFPHVTYSELEILQSHFGEWSEDEVKDWHKHHLFLEKLENKFLSQQQQQQQQSQNEEKETKETKDTRSDKDQILKLISSFESNNFGVWNHRGEVLGRGY